MNPVHQKLEFEDAALTQLSAKLRDFQTRVRSLEEGCKEGESSGKTKGGNPGIKIDSKIRTNTRDQGAFGKIHQHPRAERVFQAG